MLSPHALMLYQVKPNISCSILEDIYSLWEFGKKDPIENLFGE